ncbi:hypothetical protein B484DRAFT_396448 [Ochromonadaceae sp. CCMP2298]|nr:hypothetical protein B484DRAFT_396448 [Ochromonadaceae sp. CCMP2298]
MSASELTIAQQLLEHNEDIIAAIVENLQLGRLEDCMAHYSILHANLVGLATELDNFPGAEEDPYRFLQALPDQVMRKDLLEDLQPASKNTTPRPQIPPCAECLGAGRGGQQCREVLGHLHACAHFSSSEREDLFHATQVLSARHQQISQDAQMGKCKRNYKRWGEHEKYTLLVAISIFGTKDVATFKDLLETRSENQIRSFISKNLRDNSFEELSAEQLMDCQPQGYQPPRQLASHFAAHEGTRAGRGDTKSGDLQAGEKGRGERREGQSELAPQQGMRGFDQLLSMAAGVVTAPHQPQLLLPTPQIQRKLSHRPEQLD